ncbi:DNA replication/repair protein RecF [Alloprevotella sp. Lung230]|uniref:DNA replication/repair protein RecF n=1 Tax=Alloprevotella sp. Lung230 TaxID=2766595 RepID=UPI0016556AB2|nr:DNA replication/repair protein RecF [Alloprevotella sp. Lung230]MBC8625670.1 DNA replication/repair protein RecF [Alloprevotella sp. Lung230]
MILEQLSILNYKNIEQAELSLSPNVNCFIGANGMGKTNVLDAIYFLSFGKSAGNQTDSYNIRHEADFLMVQGRYRNEIGEEDVISCGVKRGQRKRIRRNDKEYKRVSEHVGVVPLVLISPTDSLLIIGGSEERRKFMDIVISQSNPAYLEALIRYNKTLQQRNALLKQEDEADWNVCSVLEELMAADAERIYAARQDMVEAFCPIFKTLYARLCNQAREEVDILYKSHHERGNLLPLLQQGRERERIVGYTLHGPHKDDLELLMNGHSVRREGSQGQSKTFFIAMKLAQFLYLKSQGRQRTPLLLLDDIFDKLDAGRVACIVDYVGGDDFGQIFITDTNREHLDSILSATTRDYRLFTVEAGRVEG